MAAELGRCHDLSCAICLAHLRLRTTSAVRGRSFLFRTFLSNMKVAEQYDVCVPFFEQARRATARLLLLDYDGTLAPFTPERMQAFPNRSIPQLISKIMRAHSRVVLISGRSAR